MAIGAVSDLWEPHTLAIKVGQIKGALLMVRLLKALPGDAKQRIEEGVKKGEIE